MGFDEVRGGVIGRACGHGLGLRFWLGWDFFLEIVLR